MDHQHHRQADVQVEKTEKTTQNSETDKDKVVEDRLAKMTLEEKVGQLFWARVPANNQIEDLKPIICLVISYLDEILKDKP